MLWKEITLGFLIAGFVAQLGNGVLQSLFLRHAPAPLPALENVVIGPLIAVASFVCSVGNVPLAAVLWSGGIGFAGVLAFLFADLIVLPIILIYRKYYGGAFALRIVALMFVTMVVAALVVAGAVRRRSGWCPPVRGRRGRTCSARSGQLQAGAQRDRPESSSRPCSGSPPAAAPRIRCAG